MPHPNWLSKSLSAPTTEGAQVARPFHISPSIEARQYRYYNKKGKGLIRYNCLLWPHEPGPDPFQVGGGCESLLVQEKGAEGTKGRAMPIQSQGRSPTLNPGRSPKENARAMPQGRSPKPSRWAFFLKLEGLGFGSMAV